MQTLVRAKVFVVVAKNNGTAVSHIALFVVSRRARLRRQTEKRQSVVGYLAGEKVGLAARHAGVRGFGRSQFALDVAHALVVGARAEQSANLAETPMRYRVLATNRQLDGSLVPDGVGVAKPLHKVDVCGATVDRTVGVKLSACVGLSLVVR